MSEQDIDVIGQNELCSENDQCKQTQFEKNDEDLGLDTSLLDASFGMAGCEEYCPMEIIPADERCARSMSSWQITASSGRICAQDHRRHTRYIVCGPSVKLSIHQFIEWQAELLQS